MKLVDLCIGGWILETENVDYFCLQTVDCKGRWFVELTVQMNRMLGVVDVCV